MKELSIEEKAKAYDKVLEWATEAHKVCDGMLKEDLEHLFPELKESDDEKIRKDIVFYIAAHHKDDGEKARWLYWLEKHGEQKPVWSEEDERYLNRCITKIEIDILRWEGHGKTMIDGDKEIISWLKSLKDRYTWKPSDEQMLAINTAINVLGKGTINGKYLIELQEQLKKLKG